MEDRCCMLARMFFEIGIGCAGERTDGAGNVIIPCRRSGESFDRLDALDHRCDVELGVKHVGVDERSVEGIGGLNGDGSTCL